MKKRSLAFLGILVLAIGVLLAMSQETIALSINGYKKTCSYLPDGQYCVYCKCETGKGYQGIPSWQCDDGSKPVCVSSLDEINKLDEDTQELNKDKKEK
ncbi:MAG: hypothetical protein PHX61_08485 [Alphaproteobacteria bacterium]|nr:hypothetical protein [Alphaproteobacteria bacterium]OIN86438.1 MAG: hypothetical protein AUJ12_05680 [Alphaproteobacteria bacterium CG1_02_46_17]